jgi:5-methylcytosine-specific restriction endonuclease McrA
MERERIEAKARGLARYTTGRPCGNGHLSERRTSNGQCIACYTVWCAANAAKLKADAAARYLRNIEKVRAYRAENAEAIRKARAAYYAANRGRYRKWWSEYYATNSARLLENNAAYRKENAEALKQRRLARYAANPNYFRQKALEYHYRGPEKSRAKRQAFQKANPDYWRDYGKKYPEKIREWGRLGAAARRARVLGNGGKHTEADIEALLIAQQGCCAICQIDIRKRYHVDHIMPLSKGGSNDKSNLQLLCRPCNLRKGAKVLMRVEG